MSNTTTADGLIQGLALTGSVINLFNGWQLQDAQYNGVKFYIANAIPGLSNGTLNNYAQIVNSVSNFFGSNDVFPLNSFPPLGTDYFLKNVTDRIRRKLIVHNSINSNTNVIEDMGFGAERFSVLGIISGNNYYEAYQNMLNYFLARRGDDFFDDIPAQYQNVFTHPVRGDIPGTYIDEFQVIHSYTKYKAIVFAATFVTSNLNNQFNTNVSWANQISQALSILISSVGAIQNAILDSQIAINSLSATYSGTEQQQIYPEVIIPNLNNVTIPMIKGCGTILYNNLTPPGLNNYYFQNQTINYSRLPELVPFSYGFNFGSIPSLLSVYEQQCQLNIDAINALDYDYNTDAFDLPFSTILANVVQSIKSSYSALYELAVVYGLNNQNSYKVYEVPYTMSIRMICFLNSIDFNNPATLDKLYQINASSITSVNFIPKDTQFLLPVEVLKK